MRLGILGGTFDPIHYAHLFIAEEARVRCRLNRVLLVPNAVSPFKQSTDVSSPEHRLAMCRLAVEDNPAFEVSRLEIDRPGPSYTVDTLRSLKADHPDAELVFITGVDAVADIEDWHEPDEVLRLARIVATTRPGHSWQEAAARLRPETRNRIDYLDTLPLDISATQLRARVRAELPLRYLTPDSVVRYIDAHRLYR